MLAVGVEKMWTGDRRATLAGVEDGVPLADRRRMHEKMENPSGSVLMALNASWAEGLWERGATLEQFAAAAVKARRHGALNPRAHSSRRSRVEEVLKSPTDRRAPDAADVLVLHRRRRRRRAVADRAAGAPVIRSSTVRSGNGDMDYHDRLAETGAAAWDEPGIDPEDVDVVELHDATSPEELFALESLGFFKPGDAGPATVAGDTTIGGRRADRQPQWRSGGPGTPAGCHRHRPGRRAGGPAERVTPVRGRSTAPDWRWRPTRVA